VLCVGFDLAAVVEWSGVLEWSSAAVLMSQSNQSVFELSCRRTACVDVPIQLADIFLLFAQSGLILLFNIIGSSPAWFV